MPVKSMRLTLSRESIKALSIKPKQEQSSFTQLDLHFKKRLIHQMVLRDSLQQITTFTFSQVVADVAQMPIDVFTFVVPEGTDIIYDK